MSGVKTIQFSPINHFYFTIRNIAKPPDRHKKTDNFEFAFLHIDRYYSIYYIQAVPGITLYHSAILDVLTLK